MDQKCGKVLLIGFGNPGRLDDGLGPALAAAIEGLNLPDLIVDSNYQLTVEDAAVVSENDFVVFADAAVSGPEPFYFKKIEPRTELSFSSHSVEPEAVLGLAYDMFNAKTKGYILGIRGYEFDEFGERLSKKAKDNLEKAIEFIIPVLKNKDFME